MSPHQNAHNDKVSYKADGQGMEAVTMVREARVDIFIFLRLGLDLLLQTTPRINSLPPLPWA